TSWSVVGRERREVPCAVPLREGLADTVPGLRTGPARLVEDALSQRRVLDELVLAGIRVLGEAHHEVVEDGGALVGGGAEPQLRLTELLGVLPSREPVLLAQRVDLGETDDERGDDEHVRDRRLPVARPPRPLQQAAGAHRATLSRRHAMT